MNKHGGSTVGTLFGGFKESGIGKNGSLEELLAYTRLKNVNVSMDGDLGAFE